MGRLDGKVAIVTGGGGGLGASMSAAFVAEGATVYVLDVSGKQDDVAGALGDAAQPVHADVTDTAAMAGVVQRAVQDHGRLDILCNNAGIDGVFQPVGLQDDHVWDTVMDVNLKAVYLGTKAAVEAMADGGGGSILNTASIGASMAVPLMSAYCSAKAAVVHLTKITAVEYGPRGIRANAIAPGSIRTAMTEGATEVVSQLTGLTPLRRVGRPEDVASLAVFLASDESSFITGQVITIDGGLTAQLQGTAGELWDARRG